MEHHIEIDFDSDGFDYAGTFRMKSIVDWDKLQYNETYKSHEYFRNNFPPGFEYLSGFDTIIQNMANKAKTPYEEMMEIKLSANINNDE